SVHMKLLAYLDLNSLFDSVNFQVPMMNFMDLSTLNATASTIRVGVFLCPTDGGISLTRTAPTSYRVNLGACAACSDEYRGGFGPYGLTPIASFTDGLSHTMMTSEKVVGTTAGRSTTRDWVKVHRTKATEASEWVRICSNLPGTVAFEPHGGHTWMIGGGVNTDFHTATTPNSLTPDCGSKLFDLGFGVFGARSLHPFGVNVLLADGSVRRCASTIDPAVWRALGTRNGGEVFDSR
ncbi:MAG: DUF1559 domain-containing protein, partial [Isosphaeraceae bacterium]